MAKTTESLQQSGVVYSLEGTLLEACSCNILCPCWVSEDPDTEVCESFEAYHIQRGEIEGVDVSGLTYIQLGIGPNVRDAGTWKQLCIIDAKGTDEQRRAIVAAFTGQLGGPLADLAALVGERVGIEYRDIHHEIVEGTGVLRVGDVIDARLEPYRGPDGTITTLLDSSFSTVPGTPAWVAKATHNRVNLPAQGFAWQFEGRNAIQAVWKLEHAT